MFKVHSKVLLNINKIESSQNSRGWKITPRFWKEEVKLSISQDIIFWIIIHSKFKSCKLENHNTTFWNRVEHIYKVFNVEITLQNVYWLLHLNKVKLNIPCQKDTTEKVEIDTVVLEIIYKYVLDKI